MKWLMGAVGVIIAIMGGMKLGATIEEGPNHSEQTVAVFSFEDATPAEREAWLNAVAEKLEKRGKREAAYSQFVSYKGTNVKTRAREIQTVLKLGHYANLNLDRKMLDDTLAKACPHYVKNGLHANNIKWTQKIVKQDGSVALTLPITRRSCQRFVTRS